MDLNPYYWDPTSSLSRKRTPKQTKATRTLRTQDNGNFACAEKNVLYKQVSVKPTAGLGGISRVVNGFVMRRKHIVLLGLDGSGKTTILMRLKYGCQVSTVPTIGFNHEKVSDNY